MRPWPVPDGVRRAPHRRVVVEPLADVVQRDAEDVRERVRGDAVVQRDHDDVVAPRDVGEGRVLERLHAQLALRLDAQALLDLPVQLVERLADVLADDLHRAGTLDRHIGELGVAERDAQEEHGQRDEQQGARDPHRAAALPL